MKHPMLPTPKIASCRLRVQRPFARRKGLSCQRGLTYPLLLRPFRSLVRGVLPSPLHFPRSDPLLTLRAGLFV
jgi:hypothetical protein